MNTLAMLVVCWWICAFNESGLNIWDVGVSQSCFYQAWELHVRGVIER